MGRGQVGYFGIGWHKPKRDGFFAALVAQHIPASVIAAFVFVNERLGRLNRNVVGLESNVGKKGLV